MPVFSRKTFNQKKLINYFLLVFLISAFFRPSSSFAAILNQNLKLGDKSPAVRILQQFLNLSPDTQVARFGSGSPGYETDFFGISTLQAVVRFQEKYKEEVLTPAGLQRGTGFVGPLTLRKINNLSESWTMLQNKDGKTQVSSSTSTTTPNPSITSSSPSQNNFQSDVVKTQNGLYSNDNQSPKDGSKPVTTNPNYAYLDDMIRAIWQVGISQNYSKEDLIKAEEAVRQVAATTTDLLKLFVEQTYKPGISYLDSYQIEKELAEVFTQKKLGLFGSFFEKIYDFLAPKAIAFSGQPFGGRVNGATYCTCSGNWLMYLTPTPPAYVTLLTHYSGAQGFLRYNVPFTMYVLGRYIQGGAPCLMVAFPSCITIPSQGMTTPILGSS
jgi:hypothetical protein